MNIALIFDKRRQDTMGIYFERALAWMPHTYQHFWLKDAANIKPEFDLYLRIDDGDYTNDVPHNLQPSAFWISDTHFEGPFQAISRQARNYTHVFCAMKQGIVDLKRKGIKAHWSPAACDAELHKRLDVAKALDIGYVGNDGGIPRKFYLQEIRERYPSSFLGIAEYTKMSEIYSKSRIGFNYIRPKESITMRCMEIASCGALVLVNKISDGSAEELGFKDRESLVYYNSPKELFNLIDYYLAHDDKREAIAGRGHELVVSNHTYRHRLEEMLKIIGTSLGPRQNHSGATVDSGGKI